MSLSFQVRKWFQECSNLIFSRLLVIAFILGLSGCGTTRVEPTSVEDRSAQFYNASASWELLDKGRSRILLDAEYNTVSGSDNESRTFFFREFYVDDEPVVDEVSAQHDLDIESLRVSASFNVLNSRRASLTVSPSVQFTTLERTTTVDNQQFTSEKRNNWLGIRISASSQLNDHFSVKGFGSVHYKSQEAGLALAWHTFEWLDLELGWRILDFDEALFDRDSEFAFCPQDERLERVECAYEEAQIEALFSGVSAGMHFKF